MPNKPDDTSQPLDYATPVRRRSSRAVVIPVAAGHFALFVASLFFSFSRGMSRFDTGAAPSALERVSDIAFLVLSYPLLPLLRAIRFDVPGVGGWLVIAANSLIWGLAVWLVIRLIPRRGPVG